MSYLYDAKPDLCFLQEITKSELVQHKTDTNTHIGDKLLCNGYDVVYLQEAPMGDSGGQPCNCLFYNKSKFSVITISKKECKLHEDNYTDVLLPDILKSFKTNLSLLSA